MKEMVEKLKDILGEKYFIFGECMIDSLVRIDEEIYDCENCILADTISTVRREGDVRDDMCPMVMKRE